MEGNTARGASSPAKPALHIPDPLSTTRAATSSSHIVDLEIIRILQLGHKSGTGQII
jgi:hypothetical protein